MLQSSLRCFDLGHVRVGQVPVRAGVAPCVDAGALLARLVRRVMLVDDSPHKNYDSALFELR